MLFNSASFLLFFPLVTVFYFLFPQQYRWLWLLAASCLFYMWFIPKYILILLGLVLVDYWMAILIENAQDKRLRKRYLAISVFFTCLALGVFKYFNFFSLSIARIAESFGLHYPAALLGVILPIGLSFHTFQSLSYVIEVYRGNYKAERRLGIYSLYVMFYPQLVAGPIERPQNLLHQFDEKHYFEYQRVVDGLKLMAWGMFKKVVIADRLSIIVNLVYGDLSAYKGPALIAATVFFAFQIYCDFSGYSDIAIGSAQVMGFRLMDNFNRPYFSKTISEFWKRWHISLSTWFRDYVYIPLGGNRCSWWRWQFNIFITFLISGLWHGANWTYVVWGAINGIYLVVGSGTSRWRKSLRRAVGLENNIRFLKFWQAGWTFLLICFAWIFFRAKNIQEALYIIVQLPRGWSEIPERVHALGVGPAFFGLFGFGLKWLFTTVILLGFLVFVHFIQRHGRIRQMLMDKPAWLRWCLYYAIVLGMLFLGVYEKNQFIYFQF